MCRSTSSSWMCISTPNPKVPTNSDWEPGKISTTDEDPKRLFTYRNPLFNNPLSLPPKVSNPIPPIICSGPRAGDGRPMGGVHEGSEEVHPPPSGDTPMDDASQGGSTCREGKEDLFPKRWLKPAKTLHATQKLPGRPWSTLTTSVLSWTPMGIP